MQVYIPCRCEHVRIKGDRSAGVKCGSVSLGNFNEMEILLKKKGRDKEDDAAVLQRHECLCMRMRDYIHAYRIGCNTCIRI